jgi:BirA family biotin operon repressor/biotin-[acetyl-CoA-carboxylase] ligase
MDYSALFPEVGEEIWYFPSLSRAMLLSLELIKKFPERANGRIIWAEELTQAKGRFKRKWFANKGGLWLSLSIYDEFLPETRPLIPLAIGLALLKSVHYFGATQVKLKWINDLHLNGRKLAGVLMEKWEEWLIVGMGINVKNFTPSHIPAISLKDILGKEIPLSALLSILIHWLRFYLGFIRFYDQRLLQEENEKNLIVEEFKLYSDTIGRCVYYHYNTEEEDGIYGKVLDIGLKGELILDTEEGIQSFSSGEVIYLL